MPETSQNPSEIIRNGVSLITEAPVTVTIPNKPRTIAQRLKHLIGRHPRERVFELRPLKVRTVFRISALVHSIPDAALRDLFAGRDQIEVGSLIPLFSAHSEAVVGIVAHALHNEKGEPAESLKELIRDEFDMPLLQRVLTVVVHQMRLTDFMTSIALVKELNVLADPKASRE